VNWHQKTFGRFSGTFLPPYQRNSITGSSPLNVMITAKPGLLILHSTQKYRATLSMSTCFCRRLQLLADSMTVSCKCHGVSGSCSVKTCWNAVPELQAIGSALYQSYTQAVRSTRSPPASANRRRPGRDLQQHQPRQQTMRQTELSGDESRRRTRGRRRELAIDKRLLVYRSSSPDYCHADVVAGSYGTRQRYFGIRN
jgi:wnt family